MSEPPVLYSPRAWVEPASYRADDWRTAASWPPPGAEAVRLQLHADGTLQPDASATGGMRTFTCDPRHPIPTRGGRNMLIEAGPADQREVRALPGYGLIYRGAPLTADMTLAGPANVTLTFASDCPDADVIAKLVEVQPDGRALLLADGVVRAMYQDGPTPEPLQSGVPVELTIRLGHVCHTIKAGCRLDLDIVGSNFPRRARNTHSGRPHRAADRDTDIRLATNAFQHQPAAPCYVGLTILP